MPDESPEQQPEMGMEPGTPAVTALETSSVEAPPSNADSPAEPTAQALAEPPSVESPPTSDTLFSTLAKAFALLGVEAMSVTLFVFTSLTSQERIQSYIVKNELGHRERLLLLGEMLGAALLVCLLGTIWLYRRGLSRADSLYGFAKRCSPLIVVGFLPILLNWRTWRGLELEFVVLASAVTWGFRRTLFVALSEPPWQAPSLGRLKQRVVRTLRVDRLPERFTRSLPTLVATGAALWYVAFFAYHTIENHYKLGTSAYDLGIEDNLLWNLLHGGPPFKSSPLGGPNAIHFGSHATIFAYVLVPFYALYQHAETLLFIQALLIGGAALPLYWFARRHVGNWAAALLAIAYVLSPAVQGTNLYDFHYPPLAPFFVWLAVYALEARRTVLAVIAVVLALSIREDVAGGLAIVGVYLAIWGGRPKAGVTVALVAVTYFVALKLVIMPLIARESAFVWMFKDLLPQGEKGFGGVLKTVLGNPAYTLSTLLVKQKVIYLLQLFAPLAFLPLTRPIGWVCALPGFFFTLLVTQYNPPISLGFQYASHWVTYSFLALVVALAHEARPQFPSDAMGRARKRSWLGAILVGTFVMTHQFGVVFQQQIALAAFDPVEFGITDKHRKRHALLEQAMALIPPRAKVAASERLVPHLSNRPDAYRFSQGPFDAEYILIDAARVTPDEKKIAMELFRANRYGVTHFFGDFMLARRGAPTDKNARAVKIVRKARWPPAN